MTDILLKLMSHFGDLSINRYYQIYEYILFQKSLNNKYSDFLNHKYFDYFKRQTLEYFRALGHIDFDYLKSKIFVLKPTLHEIKKVNKHHLFYLSGALDENLVHKLNEFIKNTDGVNKIIESNIQENYFLLPPSIFIETNNYDPILKLVESIDYLNISYQTAPNIIENAGGLKRYYQEVKLKTEPYKDLIGHVKYSFNTKKLIFSSSINEEYKMLIRYQNPINRNNYFYFKEGNKMMKVDYHWGRYLYLQQKNIVNLIIYYDNRFKKLKVPVALHLPPSLRIGLTLLSCKIPELKFIHSHYYEIYDNVLEPMAYEICIKLGQNLTYE